MDKRFQVFLSSTYADLKEERKLVIQTLIEMDCIPAGMEIFPATDEEQWVFIKKIIDDCDYYILIIGGRYGSLTKEGISYTEKEYDYALEKGLKVLAFLHEKPENISLAKSDIQEQLRLKLSDFRNRVSENRLIKYWNNASELPGLVALSLTKTIKTYPAVGWVRATSVSNEEILSEINVIRKENEALKKANAQLVVTNDYTIKEIADLSDCFEILLKYNIKSGGMISQRSNKCTMKWLEIFVAISPYLVKHPHEEIVKSIISEYIASKYKLPGYSHDIADQVFQTISLQLKAHGLVNINYSKSSTGGMALFWSITKKGEKLMMETRIIRKEKR
jgi:hypothetical protein